MKIKSFANGALAFGLCFALIACGDSSSGPTPDTGPGSDMSSSADTMPPPDPITSCTSPECEDFVFSKLMIPSSSAQATQFGFDLDGSGTANNALGFILGLLATQGGSGFDLQSPVDESVNSGGTVILVKIKGDLTNNATTVAQTWLGEEATCCPTSGDPVDPVQCAAEAPTTCFSGTFSFTRKAQPDNLTMGGSITSGTLALGPNALQLQLPLGDGAPLVINLKRAQIEGTVNAAAKTITNAKLGGVIPKSELDGTILPQIVTLLNDTVAEDPTSSSAMTILNLFDDDDNGTITLMELTENDLIKSLLGGDVDLGNELGLSVGVGFEAVAAVIVDPTP